MEAANHTAMAIPALSQWPRNKVLGVDELKVWQSGDCLPTPHPHPNLAPVGAPRHAMPRNATPRHATPRHTPEDPPRAEPSSLHSMRYDCRRLQARAVMCHPHPLLGSEASLIRD